MKWFRILFMVVMLCYNLGLAYSQDLPIRSSRKISFETDEGSYMNLAISPDGSKLLFDLLGNIFSVSSDGGSANQLTNGLALYFRPDFSSDGREFICQSDVSGSMKIYRGGLDSSADVTVNKVVSDRSGFEISTKTNTDNNKEVSPDGKFLAYVSKGVDGKKKSSLVFRHLSSGVEKILVSSLTRSDTTAIYNQSFCFSPDSKAIYISYGGKIHRVGIDTGKDEIVPFVAKVNIDLGALNYHEYVVSQKPFTSNYIRGAVTSPDGKYLYFVAVSQLYRMALPNGKPVPLVKQDVGQFQPTVSPDGRWIAYVGWSDTIGGNLWKVPVNGGNPIRLTKESGHYQQPSWSNDGRTIVVLKGSIKQEAREDFETGMLLLISQDGTVVKKIADSIPLWNKLSFSMDGKRIVYRERAKSLGNSNAAEEGEHAIIVSSDLNGNDRKVLANGELDLFLDRQSRLFRQHQQLSPDGNYMLYGEHESLFLVPLARKEGKVPVMYSKSSDPKAIRFAMGMDPYWEEGGKIVCWTFGNRFFRVRTEKIIETAANSAKQRKISGLLPEEFSTAEVRPDQTINIKVDVPTLYGKGMIAFKNVTILTMNGEQVVVKGTVLVEDGRIKEVGKVGSVMIPLGAKVLDLSGATVMPGLIDLHIHMRIPSNVYPQQNQKYLASLAYGVTTARDPYVKFDSYASSELLRAGQMIGPRLFSVGRPAELRLSHNLTRLESLEDARYFVKKRRKLGSLLVKQYSLPTRVQKQWLLQACEEAGINMTNEGDDWLANFAEIKDGSTGVEHDPDGNWGDVFSDVVTFVAKSGTFLTPTLQAMTANGVNGKDYFNYNYWHHPDKKLQRFLDSFEIDRLSKSRPVTQFTLLPNSKVNARLRKAGALIGMGSHGDNIGTGPHSELWALQMGGMSNMEALQSATIIGAKALGMEKDLGSIEVGKIADLIILNKNPLDDIHNSREIRYVMKDGVLYDGDTLETLWPFKRPAPEWRYKGEYEAVIKHNDKP